MTLDEKYLYRSRKSRTNLILYVVIAIFFIITVTIARYESNSTVNSKIQIAKWNISINGEKISTNQSIISTQMPITKDTLPTNDVIRNGDTGYFDIEINPTGTEVSIDYEINLSFINLPSTNSSHMKFEYYSLDGGTTKSVLSNNTITGTANLNNLNTITYRIYWKWTGNVSINNSSDYAINANVIVRQKIS